MTNFSIIAIFALLFASAANADFVPGKDDWYKLMQQKDTYKILIDRPRIFNMYKSGCPAKDFYLDCNICRCSYGVGSRQAGCIFMDCPEIPQILNWQNGSACPAGKQFYFKCNTCNCHENGTEATCTENECPIPEESEQTEKP